jgi:predicted nucleic acid-binding protein
VLIAVLDASAILRFLDHEAGAERVSEILKDCLSQRIRILISSIQWGEIAYLICKRKGESAVDSTLSFLLSLGVEVVPATPERAVRSGLIQATMQLRYAAAFCVELANDNPNSYLITADFDFKVADKDLSFEFLPADPQRT